MTAVRRETGVRGGLPPVPSAELDPYLDAAARCFEQYGIKRTTVPDIADEVGVSRSTVYRRVGAVEDCARALLSRELHRLLVSLSPEASAVDSPNDVVEILARVATFAREHPVLDKVLADESDLVGPFLVDEISQLIARVAAFAAPFLESAMERGALRRHDPAVLAEWLVRITVSVILAPPPRDLQVFLGDVLLPALTVEED